MANWGAENVDWTERVITCARQKTRSIARLRFGENRSRPFPFELNDNVAMITGEPKP